MQTSTSIARRAAPLSLLALSLLAGGCGRKQDAAVAIQTAPVQRQDIVVDVEATGVIQPIDAVQVRSKASGQITRMPVEAGSQVKPGDLLVQIDPRDPQNRYDQALAALRAAQANLQVTKTQRDREEQLLKEGVITAPELETAVLAYANAQSQVAAAKTNLELARIALEDVTIRAPIAGTVIDKAVSKGQVISSATNSPSGGTVLLTLADLSVVMDSTLVSESDVGNVRPGQMATVTVDAYPNRTFEGKVEKIAPQATVQQSVTFFPVMIRLNNRDGALMPGMNSDVSILVERRDNVLAVPNDAVRSPRDAAAAAAVLGLNPDQVRQQLQAQRGRRGARGVGGATGSSSELLAAQAGETGQGVAPAPAQCDSMRAVLAKHPDAQVQLQAIRQQARAGSLDSAQARQRSRAILDSLHLDPRTMRACFMQRSGGAGGAAGGPSFAAGDGEQPIIGNTRPRTGIVFVKAGQSFEPRTVVLGTGNYDLTQVISGLKEGEQVALISAAALQQSRAQFQQRIQSRVGLPGVQQQGGGQGGAAGARRGGTGGPP